MNFINSIHFDRRNAIVILFQIFYFEDVHITGG